MGRPSVVAAAAVVLGLALAEDTPERRLSALPALYLSYPKPSTGAVSKSWYSSMQITASAKASGFIAQQTGDHYLGIQQRQSSYGFVEGLLGLPVDDPDEFKMVVIMAGWSPCTVEETGPNANWDNYGHLDAEGQQVQGCRIDLPVRWTNPMDHHLMTTTESLSDGRLKLTTYWKGDGDWELVGSMTKPSGSGITSFMSFTEQFGSSMLEGDNLRSVEIGPHFVESTSGTWDPLMSARYSSNSAPDVYHIGSLTADGQRWLLGVTGLDNTFITSNTPEQTSLKLSSTPARPPAFTEWLAKRDSGALPTGCAGCGKSPILNYFLSFRDMFVPMNPKQAALSFLIVLVPVAAVVGLCIGYQWYQRRRAAYGGAGSLGMAEGRPLMYPQ